MSAAPARARVAWPEVVARAAAIVAGYDSGVTLRQLFYRLVADGTLANTDTSYKTLSARTAEARRRGEFPDLLDRGRRIHRDATFTGPRDARSWLRAIYRRDRTEGQPYSLYLGVEKAGMVEQLAAWYGERGLPILALGGYGSQSYVDEVAADVAQDGRPAVLLYAGDFDPSGEDIDRDFTARTGCWDQVVRIALTADQVESYRLPEHPGKAADSRAGAFIAAHGRLVQVELDALDPDDLRGLYDQALAGYWDESAYQRSLAEERQDRAVL